MRFWPELKMTWGPAGGGADEVFMAAKMTVLTMLEPQNLGKVRCLKLSRLLTYCCISLGMEKRYFGVSKVSGTPLAAQAHWSLSLRLAGVSWHGGA